MTSKTQQLIEIMEANKLTAKKVARLLDRSTATVRIWRCDNARRPIPDHSLELLKAKLHGAAA